MHVELVVKFIFEMIYNWASGANSSIISTVDNSVRQIQIVGETNPIANVTNTNPKNSTGTKNNYPPSHYYGSQKNDYLQGDSASENFWGYQGDDHIYAGGGDDWIHGGDDWDYVLFSNAGNKVNLNKRGWQKTGDGLDKLVSIEGIDGGGGDDWLIAHNKIDSDLVGGAGNDWLTAGKKGNDYMWGGKGIDVFEPKKGGGYSSINDYEKKDWIYINGSFRKVSVDTSGKDLLIYQGNDLIAEVAGMGRSDLLHDGGKWWYIE